MTIRMTESRDSRATTQNPPTKTYRFTIAGTNNDAEVKAYAMGATPNVVAALEGILYRQDVRINPVGYNVWKVEIPYGSRKTELGSYRISFDTSGGTVHLTHSRQTVNSYGTSPPNHQQAIGVNGDQVEGVDVVIPALTVNIHFKHPAGFISLPQIKTLAAYTGAVNSASFLTFDAGEVLFLGARGAEGSEVETEVEYNFAMSQNINGLTIGSLTIDKEGHDYLWFRWQDAVSNNKTAKQPQFAYVERVYARADLAAVLGFGS